MNEGTEAPLRSTAGALLRAAREKQGLHIAALAAAIKVTPRKLDALENDRYGELPDATFTRALAQTVCRSLKIDPQPVLALLPQADPAALDHVGGSLSTPFRNRPGGEPAGIAAAAIRPMVWAGLVLLLAAIAIYFVPGNLWKSESEPAQAASASGAASLVAVPAVPSAASAVGLAEPTAAGASAVAAAATPVAATASEPRVETVFSTPMQGAAASASAASAQMPTTLVQLRTDEPSWIEARDSRGQTLLSRTVQPGESVGFDGPLPIRLTIGNAPATRITFRGRAVDLAPVTRDTVARLELQ